MLLWGVVPTAAASTPGELSASFRDKSELQSTGRAVVSTGQLAVTIASTPTGSGTTYYVDSVAGDDTGDGTSQATAWRTFTNVNATHFQPGDRILLKAGGRWDATGDAVATEAYDYTRWTSGTPTDVVGADATALLAPRGSGTADNPIVLSSYGDGAAPELNGRGVVNDVVQLTDQEHWQISNLEISNETDGFDPTTFSPVANYGQVPGEEDPLTGDLRGIHVQAENAGTLSGYDIHDVFIHDVSGVMWSISGAGLDRSKRTGGILFEGLKGDGQTVSQFADVTVRDSIIANTSFANVIFKQFSGMGENRYKDVEPGWGDRAAGKAAADGTITEDPDWRPHSNISVSGNYLSNRGTKYGWDSLYLTSVQGATVENNLVDGAGVVGIEMYYSDDVVVQDNELAEIEPRPGAADSNGIDPDRGTSNVLIQGNYIHDSGEGILLCGFGFSTAVVRYNVIQDVDKNYINPHGSSGVNVIYNNLMYNTQAPSKNNTIGFFESSGSASSYLVAKNLHYLYNNVFVNVREDVAGAQFRGDYPGVTYVNNAYYGPKVTAPTTDTSPISTDPLLGGNPADDIRNATPTSGGSPLVSSGTPVDLALIAPGFDASGRSEQSQLPLVEDFFGATITSPPSVGPTAYLPGQGNGLVTGVVEDQTGFAVAGATVTYGDASTATGENGRYAIEVPAGRYTLTPSARGYAPGSPVVVDLAAGERLGTALTLGGTTATRGSISGTVTATGGPVVDATVTVTKDDATIATATSDSVGAFTFSDVPQGDGYTVTATKHGYTAASQTGVAVAAARTVTVNLTLQSAQPETRYAINETFDGESAGSFTGTSDGVLTAKTNATLGTITVQDDAQRPGNKYLRIEKTSGTSGTLAVYNAVEQNLTGTVTIEARLQRTTTNGTPNQIALYSYTENSWNPNDPGASTSPSATLGFSGGKIFTHHVTGSSTVKNVANYTAGVWYTVRNVADLDAGTFDLYIDDMTVPVLVDQPLRTLVDDLDFFNLYVNGSHKGDLLVDYVRVNTGAPYDYDDASIDAVGAQVAGEDVELSASEDGLTYSGSVHPYATDARISVATGSPFATATVDGEPVVDGAEVQVQLATGSDDDPAFVTTVPVIVTAESGAERTYTVSLSRTNPNQLAQVRSLAVDGYELSPRFAPDRQGTDAPYAVADRLPASVTSVDLTWQLGWANQRVQVNGDVLAGGATGASVDLVDGENVIEVTANSFAGDFGTYVITLTREAVPVEPVDLAAPARATLSTTAGWSGLQDGSFDVKLDLWWGQNAREFRLFENGTLVAAVPLVPDGFGSQHAVFPVTGRVNGTYLYTGELVNTAGSTVTSTALVNVTQANPAKPSLRVDGWSGSTRTLLTDLWWGTNATEYELWLDGVKVDTRTLTAATPAAQHVQTVVADLAPGRHTFVSVLRNHAGETRSDPVVVTIR